MIRNSNKTYEISVNKSYSIYDAATMLTELSGKQIKYAAPDINTFTTALTKAGVPKEGIQGMATFCVAITQGEFDFPYFFNYLPLLIIIVLCIIQDVHS